MATLGQTTEPVDQSIWEIKKDAFAPPPPPPRQLIRGWDRAPVPARAPRLHGQKVWKRVGMRSTGLEDTQDEAQVELEKEGSGARKKSRMLTTRENIGEASWAEAVVNPRIKDIGMKHDLDGEQGENPNTSTVPATYGLNNDVDVTQICKEDLLNLATQDLIVSSLQFIPRKRTNADHIITPKKPLQQTTLDHNEHAISVVEYPNIALAKVMRRRKSLRKSIMSNMNKNTTDQKSSRAQTQPSSDIEHIKSTQDAVSGCSEPEVSVGEANIRQKVLQRSTAAVRHTIARIEQSPRFDRIESRGVESDPQNTTMPVSSIPAGSTTLKESITSFRPEDSSTYSNANLRDINTPVIALEIGSPNVCPGSQEMPTYPPSLTDSSTIPDTVDSPRPIFLLCSGESCRHVQDVDTKENVSMPLDETFHQDAETFETQNSTSEPQNQTASSTTQKQSVENHNIGDLDYIASISDGQSMIENVSVTSPTNTNKTSPLKPTDEAQQTISAMSLKAPQGLDICQNIQDIALSQVPESTSTVVSTAYDHDDTDMLRNFLTRVKANKAAKNPPKRKRSLPHSPLRLPLGDLDNNISPSPQRKVNELDALEPSPSGRKERGSPLQSEPESTSCRRSNRTRPPIREPPGAPCFIPVRRLGQDIDNTVTLRRNEEKELAALTKVNTRKNKGNALTAVEVLAKKAVEKEDPVMRQRLLKELFDEKVEKGKQDKEKKGKEQKSVAWAENLAQFQPLDKGKPGQNSDDKGKENVLVQGGDDKKQGTVKVGVRSKAALGMALNETPAPKRKMRGRR